MGGSNVTVRGKTVDPNTYAPAWPALDIGDMPIDKVTGAQLVLDRAKDASTDSIRAIPPEPTADQFVEISNVNANGTSYVTGTAIDLADYSYLSVVPEVTVACTVAATVYWKFQWSFDGTNWIDDFIEEPVASGAVTQWGAAGTPAAGDRLMTNNLGSKVRQFPIAVGYKGTTGAATGGATALGVPKLARYVRPAQKMNAACTGTETVRYHFQLY